MNVIKVIVCVIIANIIFISCDTEVRKIPEFARINSLQTRSVQEIKKPSIKPSEKMSVADATTLITSMIKQGSVNSSSSPFAGRGFGGGLQYSTPVGLGGRKSIVIEKTTSEIWKTFKVQIFTYGNKTYFVRDKKYSYVMRTEMIHYVIMDMNRNSVPELFYIGNYNSDGAPILSATAPAPPSGNIVRLFTDDTEMSVAFSRSKEIANSKPQKLEKISSTKLKVTAFKKIFYITLSENNGQKKLVMNKK